MEEKITCKLTTILAANAEEYSRLMRADEEAEVSRPAAKETKP